MWTVVYIAQSKEVANKFKLALEKVGLLAMVRPVNNQAQGENSSYEVLVPAAEIEQAHDIIIELEFQL